jgi:hypothetical protein
MDRIENNASNNGHHFWLHYSGFHELGEIYRHTEQQGGLIILILYFQHTKSRLKMSCETVGWILFPQDRIQAFQIQIY